MATIRPKLVARRDVQQSPYSSPKHSAPGLRAVPKGHAPAPKGSVLAAERHATKYGKIQPGPAAKSGGVVLSAKYGAVPPRRPPLSTSKLSIPHEMAPMGGAYVSGQQDAFFNPSLYSVDDMGMDTRIEEDDLAGMMSGIDLENLMSGVVKTWFEDRSFGFIVPDGVEDREKHVFVHKSVLKDGESLVVDSPVMFDITYDTKRKGFAATKCFGAVPAPADGGGEGGKLLGEGEETWYRPSFLEDPWAKLYTDASAHLRAHLDGVDDAQQTFSSKSDTKAAVKKAGNKPKATAKDGALDSAPAATPMDATAKDGGKEEDKAPTSIYDFFADEDGAGV